MCLALGANTQTTATHECQGMTWTGAEQASGWCVAGVGIPVAADDAGGRALRLGQRHHADREDRSDLLRRHPAADAAGAGDRRGHRRGAAAGIDDVDRVDEAVCVGVGGATSALGGVTMRTRVRIEGVMQHRALGVDQRGRVEGPLAAAQIGTLRSVGRDTAGLCRKPRYRGHHREAGSYAFRHAQCWRHYW